MVFGNDNPRTALGHEPEVTAFQRHVGFTPRSGRCPDPGFASVLGHKPKFEITSFNTETDIVRGEVRVRQLT